MPKFLFKHENRANILKHYEMLVKWRAVYVSTGRHDQILWILCWFIPAMAFTGWGPSLYLDDGIWTHFDTVLISSSITASVVCYVWRKWIDRTQDRYWDGYREAKKYFDKYDIDTGDLGDYFRHKSSDSIYERVDLYSVSQWDSTFDIDRDYKAAEELFKRVYTEHRSLHASRQGHLEDEDPHWVWEYTIRSN